ncbi:STAS domain-containing protein [Silvimonas soli]|uniref:STAS domain-containing protein n=1 Tax=Silvimonas soli TaxID=2980100 RepID=UPI0024B38B7C|nr:STAS domain-containing protein [Silvimonas soli]
MVFSFFKKKEGDGKPEPQTSGPVTAPRAPAAAPAPARAATAAAPAVTAAKPDVPTVSPAKSPAPAAASKPVAAEPSSYNLQELTIEVEDGSTNLTEAEEEAVVLYANGQTAAAATSLRAAIPGITGQRRIETWSMLFELYQQLGKHADFDDLALLYVVEFESTPPLWRELAANTAAAAAADAAAIGTAGYISLPAQLNGDNTSREVDKLVTTCKSGTPVRLDMSKVSGIDSMAAAELLFGWQSVRKLGSVVQVIGADSMIKLLGSKIEPGRVAPAEAPYWLLLLETTQASGNQDAFENIAIDYAVTYEVSPPSWDGSLVFAAPAKGAPASSKAAAAPPTPSTHSPDRLLLSGALLQGAAAQLKGIREFADRQSRPVLDFREVTRVDFETAGQLLNLAMELVQKGVVVRLAGANPLVAGMLRLMGIGDLVEISGN